MKKDITKNEQECIDLIKKFIKKYKGIDNIKRQNFLSLSKFPITQLKSDELQDFGDIQSNRGLRDYFECDDTELVKAILFLFYSSQTKNNELKIYHHRNGCNSIWFSGIQLTGDTLNSFNTLFSTICADSLETCNKIFPKFADKDKKLKNKIEKFYNKHYQYIGNFMLLPCNTYNRRSLNTFRSGYYGSECDFNDYFDQFLIEMKKCLKLLEQNKEAEEEPTKTFCKIIKQSNPYFKDYLQNDFDEFISFNALESYIYDNSSEVKSICSKRYRYSEYNDFEQEEYKKFADEYIKFAKANIKYRSHKILSTIWKKYKKFFN